MPRRSREDEPGSWHHVINRGIARRVMFEDRTDIRYFLSRLAREVRAGRLELHAWCILTTHFHLLVRSPRGELSEALRRAQSEYSRAFNRRHRRDGTLIRGRFLSRPASSHAYRQLLVGYIDANPVKARLVARSWEYPWCSARQYVSDKGPLWLERSWIEREVALGSGRAGYDRAEYARVFGGLRADGAWRLVEERVRSDRSGSDELDNLIGAAPASVLAWMRRKASLADGASVGLPVLDSDSIRAAVADCRMGHRSWKVRSRGRLVDPWGLIEVGLLRGFAGLTWERTADRARLSATAAQKRLSAHRRLVAEDSVYAERFSEALSAALAACLGSRVRQCAGR